MPNSDPDAGTRRPTLARDVRGVFNVHCESGRARATFGCRPTAVLTGVAAGFEPLASANARYLPLGSVTAAHPRPRVAVRDNVLYN